MKKTVAFLVIVSGLSLALSLALAHPEAARPAAVPADSWIALSPDAGFVVSGTAAGKPGTGPAVDGFFMARRDGKWVRLDPDTAGGRLVPTN